MELHIPYMSPSLMRYPDIPVPPYPYSGPPPPPYRCPHSFPHIPQPIPQPFIPFSDLPPPIPPLPQPAIPLSSPSPYPVHDVKYVRHYPQPIPLLSQPSLPNPLLRPFLSARSGQPALAKPIAPVPLVMTRFYERAYRPRHFRVGRGQQVVIPPKTGRREPDSDGFFVSD